MIETGNRPLRVLHVLRSLNRGGIETWLMDIMRNTSRNEIQIDVCLETCSTGVYEEEFKRLGGRILRCPLDKKKPWIFYHRLKQLLCTEHYDVIHSHLYYFSGFTLRSAARARVPKRIAHIHPVEDLRFQRPFRRLYTLLMKSWIRRYGTGFVGPSQASLEGFFGPNWKQDPTKQVIHNGISVERFAEPVDRAKVRRELNIPENAPIVLNVSRFAPHKRHEFLVQVAQHVLAQRQDVYFLLIGAGKLKKVIEEQVCSRGLEKNFRFVSGVPNIDHYFMSADVFAFPSCNEGFGIAVIEAAAAGLNVVAQDIPGVREAATACADPILLPLDTPAGEWAQVVLDALRLPRMSERQRQILLRDFPFTIENSVKKLRQIYSD